MSTTYVVISKYLSGGEPMSMEYHLTAERDEPHGIDPLGAHPATLVEHDVDSILEHKTQVIPNLEDLARLGRVAQAILDGREPAARNFDHKIEAQ